MVQLCHDAHEIKHWIRTVKLRFLKLAYFVRDLLETELEFFLIFIDTYALWSVRIKTPNWHNRYQLFKSVSFL